MTAETPASTARDVCTCGHHALSHWPDNGAGRPCWGQVNNQCRCDNFGPAPTPQKPDPEASS